MKRVYIFIAAMFIATLSMAQNAPIDFETGGYGSGWTWNVFENNTNPALEFVANPDKSGINTSDNVAKFTALQAGQPWAGTESVRDAAFLGHFVLDATNSTIKIKVHKPVISDVGIKLVSDSGWALPEIKVANTLTNQWEELTFDFSAYANPPADKGKYVQIAIFPDFNARTQDNVIYFDDITFSAAQAAPAPTASAPAPTLAASEVLSIFSDAYNDVAGTDFYPNWGQSTVVTYPDIAGDSMLKYVNFNFQGTTFATALDPSGKGMDYIHLDMWTADATTVNFFCVSSGPTEKSYSLPVTANEWVSYDIPLAAFTGVDMADLIQLKFDGGSGTQTIFLDNIYFYIAPPTGPTVAAPTPTEDEKMVKSVFSDAYTNVAGTDFNPAWGQATVVSYPEIVAGDTALKYANFNFQGTTFGSAIDASNMEYLHLDMWTADASTVNVFCISTGPVEKSYALTVKANEWVSYDIPLTDFTGVDMTDLIQFKFDGGTGTETIFLDNLYFYTTTNSIEESRDNQLAIYPNPVISGQTIMLKADVRLYNVYDNTGRNILSGASQELYTGSLMPGAYFIVVETLDGTILSEKIIVK
jgi:hypothetical protein